MEYGYNLSGALVEQKYPSGRVVRNVLDNDGDLSMVRSKRNANHGYWNYAHHFTYTAAGAVASMQLGNGAWETTAFNSRLQPTRIALGKVQNATDLLKLDYTYGVVENNQLDTAKNNGNIQSQTITVPTVGSSNGFTAVQAYSYDSLNRIDDAKEVIGSTEIWKQDYTFDRYGNRNFDEANTTTIPKNCGISPNFTICPADRKVFNPSIAASSNRINLDQDGDSVNDYAFDAVGNTTRDAQLRKFTYDAENKQTKIETVDSNGTVTGTIGQYSYDGDGRRVKKIAYSNNQVTETTVFVYDASSRLVAEYSTIQNPTPQVAYLTNDHLGSPRVNTNENGAVTSRHDYRPYGEGITERTHSQYTPDTIRKQFTGYQRDDETDLDFAQTRMLNTSVGRFGTPDPYNVILEKERGEDEDERAGILIGFISNPQRWKVYIYVVNNPLAFADPDGQKPITINIFLDTSVLSPEGLEGWQKWAANAQKKDKNLTVNIYLMSKDTPGTVNAFLESLKAKDTATIFMGHASEKGILISGRILGNSQDQRQRNVNDTADGIDIQNVVVALFSCGFGNGFNNITSSNSTAFVSIVQGSDRTTVADATNAAAFRFTESLASGSWEPLLIHYTLNDAVRQGQGGISAFTNRKKPNVNAGDYVGYRWLPPPRKRR